MGETPLTTQAQERFVFFSLRSFQTDVGETLRIYGIVNAVAAAGHEAVLISNATGYDMFHPAVKHVFIDCSFSDKRLFQALASVLPAAVVRRRFSRLFTNIEKALAEARATNQTVFFFDYLDNTVGYVLKQMGKIAGYLNDVHGIATTEFLSNKLQARSLVRRQYYRLKAWAADRLDKKVFEAAEGFLFGSTAMKDYFEKRYSIADKKSLVLPYLLDAFSLSREIEPRLHQDVASSLRLGGDDFVFMFVGSYKATAGVEDLVETFSRLYQQCPSCRLILIGDGPYRQKCEQKALSQPACRAITFLDPVPYSALPAYYAAAHVIVCPDRDNPFSQYVVHIKYLDALATGKLVINGAFKSVREINEPEPLSVLFEPSNQQDLYRALHQTHHQYAALKEKYKHVVETTKYRFTYAAHTAALSWINTFLQKKR